MSPVCLFHGAKGKSQNGLRRRGKFVTSVARSRSHSVHTIRKPKLAVIRKGAAAIYGYKHTPLFAQFNTSDGQIGGSLSSYGMYVHRLSICPPWVKLHLFISRYIRRRRFVALAPPLTLILPLPLCRHRFSSLIRRREMISCRQMRPGKRAAMMLIAAIFALRVRNKARGREKSKKPGDYILFLAK